MGGIEGGLKACKGASAAAVAKVRPWPNFKAFKTRQGFDGTKECLGHKAPWLGEAEECEYVSVNPHDLLDK